MKLRDVHSAKRLIIKIRAIDPIPFLKEEQLVEIRLTQKQNELLLSLYGEDTSEHERHEYLYETDPMSFEYIKGILDNEKQKLSRYIFQIEAIEDSSLLIQTYEFSSISSYKTPICIQVADHLLGHLNLEKLHADYTWDGLGLPAVFVAGYQRKNRQTQIRILSNRRFLTADNTASGIIAKKENFLKYFVPCDLPKQKQ